MKESCLPLLFDFLFLFGYFYLPSESMSNLYHRIPAQVRENSQLVAAYYYSQTGFDGFREYQFALYDPENKTISIYTFKTYKFLKIWPRMKKSKITCKTPFNYSTLSTNPEKLKDFKTATTADNSSTGIGFTGMEKLRAFTLQCRILLTTKRKIIVNTLNLLLSKVPSCQ